MMAKTSTTKTVETLTHGEAKRRNIPTAEYQSVLDKEQADPVRVAYERRNRDLDPQLVWRGKDEQDWSDLVVHAPPLYIQEKVHPKVLIDDLLRQSAQAKAQTPGAQIDMFADFNGLPNEDAKTEFYQHDQNWSNRMILGDSLQVMASLAEREGLRGKVQCIYLDPPYGIKFNSNFQWSTTSRDALPPHGHRPRRPRARPHLRFRHHCLRRRAVGPPLDHHRHLARGPGLARARIMGARYPYYLLADSREGQVKEAEVTGSAPSPASHGARQHPPRLRLRARAAHHAQVHRQQRRDRRHLGEVAGRSWNRCASAERRLRQEARPGRSGRFRASAPGASGGMAGLKRRSCTPTGGRRASRGRRRSTPPSPPRPSSSTSTTSPTRTRRRSAWPGRSPSRASRPTACWASTRTTN
jgi:hypothetical protein